MLLTPREAASLLACSERQVFKWVHDGEIPFQRVRDQVRFNRTELLEWATARRLPVPPCMFDVDAETAVPPPSLPEALRVGGAHHDVVAADRDEALRAALDRTPMPPGLDRDFVFEVLVARENTVSTAIGDGIAIPHVRQPIVGAGAPAAVSVSYLRTPVVFAAIDGKPVHTLFLITSPTILAHLQMLSQVANALLDPEFRAAVDRRAGTEELCAFAAGLEGAPRAGALKSGAAAATPKK